VETKYPRDIGSPPFERQNEYYFVAGAGVSAAIGAACSAAGVVPAGAASSIAGAAGAASCLGVQPAITTIKEPKNTMLSNTDRSFFMGISHLLYSEYFFRRSKGSRCRKKNKAKAV
jgi:hypothetical protein